MHEEEPFGCGYYILDRMDHWYEREKKHGRN